MAVFKKRETLLENITYMAIMAAINVVFVLLTFFVPFLLFLLVFVLPLSSAIVTVYCKKRYYPIYAIVTIGICMLVTITNFGDTIFFVVPSIITGFIFGVLIKTKTPAIIIIFVTSIVQTLLTYPGFWLASAVLYPDQKDIFVLFTEAIGISSNPYVSYVKHLSIGALALIQETVTFIVIKEESEKVGITVEEENWMDKLFPMVGIFLMVGLSVLFAFIYPEISYLFMIGSTLFVIHEIIKLISEKKIWIYIALAASLFISIFTFACVYRYTPQPLGLLYVQVFYCLVAIIVLINNYLLTAVNKDKITK